MSTPAGISRVSALLDFLEGFHRLARPPVRDIAEYADFVLRESQLPVVPGVGLTPGGVAWLSCRLVEHEPFPVVPEELAPWITRQTLSPVTRPSVPLTDDSGDKDLEAALKVDEWGDTTWTPWAGRWRVVDQARRFYKELYGLRARLERDRDGVELVWGFGQLRWDSSKGAVDHPLITVGVEVSLDEDGQLHVIPTGPTEIESACLADISLADRQGYLALRQAGAADETDPWNNDGRQQLLKHLLRFVDHDGVFSEGSAEHGLQASVVDEWVLYVRRRPTDYVGFLEAQRELYRTGTQPALPFLSLVVDEPSALHGPAALTNGEATLEPTSRSTLLYLPKSANEEQFRILRLAQDRTGVTAQGPPGTGKSHTIANLICHFVAQGQRVLVSAEKEQALSVLAEKLPPAVRELTVAVLGSDQTARTRLEHAIHAIQHRVSTYDPNEVESEIRRNEAMLEEVDAAIAEAANQLRAARVSETTRLRGGYEAGIDPSPSVVADWLRSNETNLGIIPDAIARDVVPPLDANAWVEFGELISYLRPDDIAACALRRPPTSILASGATLAPDFDELLELRNLLADTEEDVVDWARIDATSADQLADCAHRLEAAAEWHVAIAGTWLEQVALEAGSPLTQQEWRQFVDGLRAERESAVTERRVTLAFQINVPRHPSPETVAGLREARDRFTDGRGVSKLLQRGAAKAIEACTIEGRNPVTAEEVDLCLAAISRQQHQRRLWTLWTNGTTRVGGPQLRADRDPEDAVGEYLDDLERALAWAPETWPGLADDLRAAGLLVPEKAPADELRRLEATLKKLAIRARERQLSQDFEVLHEELRIGMNESDASPLWQGLQDALSKRAWVRWDELAAEAHRLAGIEERVARHAELRESLGRVAPRFTASVASPQVSYPEYEVFARAWQWRQLEGWLATITSGPPAAEVQRRLEELAGRRLHVMEELVAAKAWQGLARSFDDRKRGSLNKYLTAINRFGKTGGKYRARWLREIREALEESTGAVPVWIMTAGRVLTSFRPEQVPPFDVLIVDEASQIGLLGLPMLSLAAKAIVVGDDQQTSPENVGLDRQSVFDLIDDHLIEVKGARMRFDADNSLYDVARQQFPEVVVLQEHFRCLPEIIGFSNARYYDNRMVPLRDDPPAADWRSVGTVFVPDGFRGGKDTNEPEALATVDLVEELCANESYDGMTFGVVNLLGRSQARRIQDLLFDRLGPEVLEERAIRCGEPADFQGDERDVIVISTVADKPEGGRVGAMNDRKAERRVNVAASRAKNQMWIVHSLDPGDFPAGDPRAELIRHCQNPAALESVYEGLEQRCESQFERDVLRRILQRGYRRVRTQHKVGGFRIDIVIEGSESRLAVECDGDAWHGADQWDADRIRQQKLERAGWTFERIRASAFYRKPELVLGSLWTRLDELDIRTGDLIGRLNAAVASRRVARTMAQRLTDPPIEAPTGTTGIEPAEERDESLPVSGVRKDLLPPPPEFKAFAVPEDRPRTVRAGNKGSPELSVERFLTTTGKPSERPAPYVSWEAHPASAVLDSPGVTTVPELLEIVSAEGPLHALRLYQLHAKAAGSQRVGREMRHAYNQLIHRAVRVGKLREIQDALPGQINKTLYGPEQPAVIVRALGPRQLHEVPQSEIVELIRLLGLDGAEPNATKRAVLDSLGLFRMTQKTNAYLDECLQYTWSP